MIFLPMNILIAVRSYRYLIPPGFTLLLSLCLLTNVAQGQTGAWEEANAGLADFAAGESLEVTSTLTLNDGRVFAFIRNHSGGETRDGVYRYDPAANQWTKVAPRLNQYGYSALVSSGTRIFGIPGGDSQEVYELNVAAGTWEKVITLPDLGLALSRGIDALGDFLYVPCRIESESTGQEYPDLGLQVTEEFVLQVNIDQQTITYLRNPDQPLLIKGKGGNPQHPIALTNGKVYHYSTFDYRDNNGTGGVYEWDGTRWISATAGLNAINITGNGFGPVGPIFTDVGHQKLFVKTEQGLYEKTDGGWFKYFYRTGALLFISSDYLFLQESNGGFSRVDQAVTTSLTNQGLECIERMENFVTPDNGATFLAEMRVKRDAQGNCSDQDEPQRVGMYRYVPDYNQPGKVKNLHLEMGTYLGGTGANEVAQTTFTPGGALLVAGNFNQNMDAPTTPVLGASENDRGKIYALSADGMQLTMTIVLGEAVYDMDVNAGGEIAVIGSFGVAVLRPDYTLKWSSAESLSERPRLAMADDGRVVGVVASASNGPGQVKLYDSDGSVMHVNANLDNNGGHINNVEISASQGQYYVVGYTQASSVLQVAYLRAYTLDETVREAWKTWGFGANEINTNENGADTRIYHVKATADQLYVAGETAGGGPGGFTVFAYDGQGLTNKIALNGNDFFTDGTNSCGACHITFLGKIDPTNGLVKKGKFVHARLSNGKTNTHRNRHGDLEVDDQGNVLLVGQSAFQIQDRDVFNVNGELVGAYVGDQYVLMTTPDFDTRLLWGVFSREGGNGSENRVAFGYGKVAYLAQTDQGRLITTDNAFQAEPYNTLADDGSLSNPEVYLAVWNRNVWETANEDEVELAFIPEDACFRADDEPCLATVPDPDDPANPDPANPDPSLPNPLDPDDPALAGPLKAFNLITPNGDGRNDVWAVAGLQDLGSYHIRVVTRTGQPIFETDNYRQDWSGTHQGRALPAGVYYYSIVVAGQKKAVTGYVTILY